MSNIVAALQRLGYSWQPSTYAPKSWQWYNQARLQECEGRNFPSEEAALKAAFKDARYCAQAVLDMTDDAWDKLSDEQKAEVMVNTLFVSFSMMKLAVFGPGGQYWSDRSPFALLEQLEIAKQSIDEIAKAYRLNFLDDIPGEYLYPEERRILSSAFEISLVLAAHDGSDKEYTLELRNRKTGECQSAPSGLPLNGDSHNYLLEVMRSAEYQSASGATVSIDVAIDAMRAAESQADDLHRASVAPFAPQPQ